MKTINKTTMEQKQGLLNETIRLVKKNEELTKHLRKNMKTLVDESLVQDMLKYNVWTIRQFSDLTGYKEATILNKTRPIYKGEELVTELDFCFPFMDTQGTGPKFIVRNEKSEKMLPKIISV